MQKVKFGSHYCLNSFYFKIFAFISCFIFWNLLNGCSKNKISTNDQTYNQYVDTATLVLKITNTDNLPIDISIQPTRLLLFDSKNLYYNQLLSKDGIKTKDTSIFIHGIAMGHYTALLIVDAPGIINLNYLNTGKQSYQNVMDTLQYLLTDTYVASAQSIIVNNKVNTGSINFVPLVSLISQVSFDFSELMNLPIWKNPNLTKYELYYLEFQNNTLVRSKPIKIEDFVSGIYQMPVPKGANYSFMFADLPKESTAAANIDSMINGKTTPAIVQQKLEKEIDYIRMGNVLCANLLKTEQTYKVENSIINVPIIFTGKTSPKEWVTDCQDWNLLIFDQSRFLKRIIYTTAITQSPSPKDALVINLFKNAQYTLMPIGNASGAVSKYQAQNEITPIKPEYILTNQGTNLQAIQDELYAWIAIDSGIISSRLINEEFKMNPEIRLNLTKMPTMTIAEVRTKTGNYFSGNPHRVTGVVTSIGKQEKDVNENPMTNLIILQDGQNAAIPIEFKTVPEGLKIGDQLTVALQDGLMTTSNINANNILVLEKATYTEVEKQFGVGVPNPKLLTLAEAIDPIIYEQNESLLVEVQDLEFKWFKDIQYGTYSSDSIILRDNNATTAPSSSLPEDRKTINMVTSKNASVKFAGTTIPVGKVDRITGFLVKTTSSNRKIAIMPRKQTDVVCMDNTFLSRVDQGIVGSWYDGVIGGNTSSGFTTNVGIASFDKENTNITAGGGYNSNYFYNSGGLKTTGFDGNATGRFLLIKLNTKEMLNGENLQISIKGFRDGNGLLWNASNVSFNLQYYNGTTFVDIPGSAFTIAGTRYGGNFELSTTIIPNIGGNSQSQIKVICTSGGTGSSTVDYNIWWQNITITQVP